MIKLSAGKEEQGTNCYLHTKDYCLLLHTYYCLLLTLDLTFEMIEIY